MVCQGIWRLLESSILHQSHYQAENGTADGIQGPVAPWLQVTDIEQCRCSAGLSGGCRSVAAAACPPEEMDKRAANAASCGPEAGLFSGKQSSSHQR